MGRSLPERALASAQHQWLSAARSRLLRQAGIARRREILEIGAGWGFASDELRRRSGGNVVALDACPCGTDPRDPAGQTDPAHGVQRVTADACQLPYPANRFDLVFAQFTLLWIAEPQRAVAEAYRVLQGGAFLAVIEPDYGGLMEYPPTVAVQAVWLAALARAGADPCVGRKLPHLLQAAGFAVTTLLPDRLQAAGLERFTLLRGLPLTADEARQVDQAEAAARRLGPQAIAHLPLWMMCGLREESARH